MSTKIFVSYPATDLEKSRAFYTAIGGEIQDHFTDENALCLKWGEDIFFMVLKREFMATFTTKEIADPRTTAQVQSAFTRDSREEVDAAVAAGLAAGGTEPHPAEDYGFMYSRDLEDPDGNVIAFTFMEPKVAEIGPAAYAAAQAQA